ncbi:MAG: helix-turn-helix domain-containing protein [Lachnospiraceae bacterium]|nr:helix-turn-helix domain-containing protein [Lachnospiraceae bacterium]
MNTKGNVTYQREEDLIFYTPKDLEHILQFKSTKIQQLLKQQINPSVKLGGQYRVSKEQLEEWFKRNAGKEFDLY